MGSCIHATVVERGLLRKDIALSNALLNMYAKCGALGEAKDLFNQLPSRKIVTWNALIAGYAQYGLCNEAFSCLLHMRNEGLTPNAVTFICILKSCGNAQATEKGEETHAEIDKEGLLQKDIRLGNALVDMYVKCGLLGKAFQVLEKLPAWDVVTWNTLISGYTQHGLGDEALSFFSKMINAGIPPSVVTFICLLKACGSMNIVEKGKGIHAEVSRRGLLKNNITLGTALVDMYVSCGMVAKAQEVFDRLSARDLALWTALIAGYANQGLGDEALGCFARMLDEGFSPDAMTFVCILKACAISGAAEKGKEIHKAIDRQGFLERDVMLGTTLVDMYAKCGEVAKAHEVFDELPARVLATWTALIAGYAQLGMIKMVLDLFIQMGVEGQVPDVVTYVVLLTACSHAGLVEEAHFHFEKMSSDNSIIPTVEHHACMVDTLVRAGLLDEAMSMIKEVPHSECFMFLSTLFGACHEPVYADLGRWDASMDFLYGASGLQADVH